MANPFVSIVIPVFNEENNLEKEYRLIKDSMEKSEYSYEIIIVNDSSTDNSLKIAKELSPVKLINLEKKSGSGSARKIGTINALGDIIVWTDCDLTYPNHLIPAMLKEMLDKNLDQIVGLRDCEIGTLKYLRIIVKWVIKNFASLLTLTKIPDLNSGLRIFKKDVVGRYLHLLPNGFSCMATMSLSFIYGGHSVGYFPIKYSKRISGASKFNPIWDTWMYIYQILKVTAHFKL